MLPLALSINSGYLPGRSKGLISTSTKRYVPRSLTETLDARSPVFNDFTLAPRRLVPRTSKRTGLIVWPAHQEGGSTLVTDGVCATAETKQTKTNASAGPSFRFVCKCLFCLPQRRKENPLKRGSALRLSAFAREILQLPGVRGLALSPEAATGNGGKASPSFAGASGVALCRLTSSNRLNSANPLSASSFFFNRE